MTFLFREYPSGYLGTVDAYDYVISCDLIDTVVILLMSTLATAPPQKHIDLDSTGDVYLWYCNCNAGSSGWYPPEILQLWHFYRAHGP